MTEIELKTKRGAQSALKPKTDAERQAEEEASRFPEAARIKAAIREHLRKLASNEPQRSPGKRENKAKGRQAVSMSVSVKTPMLEKIPARIKELGSEVSSLSHYIQQLIARDLEQAEAARQPGPAETGAPAAALENRNTDRGRPFNPEIEAIILSYQTAHACSRETAIEGLLIQLLRHQPGIYRPTAATPRLQQADSPPATPSAASPLDVPLSLS
jgi:hypothetical protein